MDELDENENLGDENTNTPPADINSPDENISTEPKTDESEKVPVKFYEYFFKITKTKILSEADEKQRRIAVSNGIAVEPLEIVSCFQQRSNDEELNVLLKFNEDEFVSIETIPEDAVWFRTKTENVIEYSYKTNEETGETEEIEDNYLVKTESYYRLYDGEKDKPEERVSGLCIECNNSKLVSFPFPHFVCKKRKHVCGVTGREFYFRCRDFNEYLECNLWEKIPEEEESAEDDTNEEGNEPNGENQNGNTEPDSQENETQNPPTDDTNTDEGNSGVSGDTNPDPDVTPPEGS